MATVSDYEYYNRTSGAVGQVLVGPGTHNTGPYTAIAPISDDLVVSAMTGKSGVLTVSGSLSGGKAWKAAMPLDFTSITIDTGLAVLYLAE